MMQRADLHLHTRFSHWKHLRIIKPRDSYSDPDEVHERCKRLGMHYVVITDHDTIEGALDLLSRRPELEPAVIVGEEVEARFPRTGQWVHVNVFDVDEATHADISRLKGDVHELVGYLRRRGLYHVLNHPFQSYRAQNAPLAFVESILELFDHFEVGNATLSGRHNRAVAEMLDFAAALYTKKHGVGGSDAHHVGNIGRYVTEAPVRAEEEAAVGGKRAWLAALARGEGRPDGRTIGTGALTANVYRIIVQYYLSLRDPQVRRHMRAENYLAAAALAPICLAGLPLFLNLGNRLRLEAASARMGRALRRSLRSSRLVSGDLLEDLPD